MNHSVCVAENSVKEVEVGEHLEGCFGGSMEIMAAFSWAVVEG